MGKIITNLDIRWYPNHKSNWDNTEFRQLILKYIDCNSRVLDLGAGRGILPQMNFVDKVAFIAGADPDEAVLRNPYLHEAKQIELPKGIIPYPNKFFDVVISNNVLEHIENPTFFFSEVDRVLKSGGVFIGKTPNKHHYVPLIARLTPLRFHKWLNKKRGREEEDTFPTCYLLNTKADIESSASQVGLSIKEISIIEGRPEYMRFNVLTYFLGFVYERCVNMFSFLNPFRCVILVVIKK